MLVGVMIVSSTQADLEWHAIQEWGNQDTTPAPLRHTEWTSTNHKRPNNPHSKHKQWKPKKALRQPTSALMALPRDTRVLKSWSSQHHDTEAAFEMFAWTWFNFLWSWNWPVGRINDERTAWCQQCLLPAQRSAINKRPHVVSIRRYTFHSV